MVQTFSAQRSQPGREPRHSPPGFFYGIIFFSEATLTEFTITIMVYFIEHFVLSGKGPDRCFDGTRAGSARYGVVKAGGALAAL